MHVCVVCLAVLACACVSALAGAQDEIKSGKPGFCPPSLDPPKPKCKDQCKTDVDCKANRKCCISGCGLKCVVPAKDDCSVVADCMPLTCKRRYIPAGACCQVCKNNEKNKSCKKNGKTYGEGGKVPSRDPCESCFCQGGRVLCALMSCAPPQCEDYYVPPGQCCPVCKTKSCVVNGTKYKDGEDVPDADPCKSCWCDRGEVVCAIMDCAAPPCEDPISIPGKCCPVCNTDTFCTVVDKVYKDLEDIPDGDPCKSCICSRGEVVCSTIFCDIPQCMAPAAPYTAPGECCPGCKTGNQ